MNEHGDFEPHYDSSPTAHGPTELQLHGHRFFINDRNLTSAMTDPPQCGRVVRQF